MVTGGRVLTYLTKYIEKPETRLLLVGYQAEGTRGRKLQEGAHEVKIYGKYYPVKAKIILLQGLSAHADQRELLDWLGGIKNMPEKVFIVHGEAHAADVLRVKIKDEHGWECIVPELYSIETIELQEQNKQINVINKNDLILLSTKIIKTNIFIRNPPIISHF